MEEEYGNGRFSMNSFNRKSIPTYFGLQHNFSFKPAEKKKWSTPLSRKKKPQITLFSEKQHSEISQMTFLIKLVLYHRPD